MDFTFEPLVKHLKSKSVLTFLSLRT